MHRLARIYRREPFTGTDLIEQFEPESEILRSIQQPNIRAIVQDPIGASIFQSGRFNRRRKGNHTSPSRLPSSNTRGNILQHNALLCRNSQN
jgi:hypothetical protein